jgi:hypothetical protein
MGPSPNSTLIISGRSCTDHRPVNTTPATVRQHRSICWKRGRSPLRAEPNPGTACMDVSRPRHYHQAQSSPSTLRPEEGALAKLAVGALPLRSQFEPKHSRSLSRCRYAGRWACSPRMTSRRAWRSLNPLSRTAPLDISPVHLTAQAQSPRADHKPVTPAAAGATAQVNEIEGMPSFSRLPSYRSHRQKQPTVRATVGETACPIRCCCFYWPG